MADSCIAFGCGGWQLARVCHPTSTQCILYSRLLPKVFQTPPLQIGPPLSLLPNMNNNNNFSHIINPKLCLTSSLRKLGD